MKPSKDTRKLWAFVIVWFGQLISLIGSGMTNFAIGVWVFLTTGSITQFALIAFFGALPGILALPVAGVLVDRWGGRRAMIVADVGEGLSTLSVAILLSADRLTIPAIYVIVMVNAMLGSLRWPAFSTLPPRLVPLKHLSRAAGMVQTSEAAAAIVAPFLAGILVTTIELRGVIVLDFFTYVFGIATLIFPHFNNLKVEDSQDKKADGKPEKESSSFASEVAYGWHYIRSRPGLWALLIFFAVTNFTVLGLTRTLFTPLILGFTSPRRLGFILSIGGVGFLIGSIMMSVWGGPKRRIRGVLGFTLLQGFFVMISGMRPSLVLLGTALFMISWCFPIVAGCSQALWQSKVALDVQGRVFAVRRMVGWSSFPIAYLVGGPLADFVFEPLLASGGPLADTVGLLIGVGPGRGIGFLFIILGISTILAVALSYRSRRLRWVEDELPDIVSS